MAHIEKITLTVEVSDGTQITLVETTPQPWGDNPRFTCTQMLGGTTLLRRSMFNLLSTKYGAQEAVL